MEELPADELLKAGDPWRGGPFLSLLPVQAAELGAWAVLTSARTYRMPSTMV